MFNWAAIMPVFDNFWSWALQRWQDGDLALIDNRQVMHGRFPYAGARKREVLVVLTKD